MSKIEYPNNFDREFGYDSDTGRVTDIDVIASEGPFAILGSNYEYDDVGNLTHSNFTIEEYNDIDQEWTKYKYGYTYDAVGNRMQMTYDEVALTTYQYNAGNQLTDRDVGAVNYDYTFDDNGNMTDEEESGDSRSFTWNRDERMTQVTNELKSETSTESELCPLLSCLPPREVDKTTTERNGCSC